MEELLSISVTPSRARDTFFGDQESSSEVRLDYCVPSLEGHVTGQRDKLSASVIDQEIQLAELGQRSRDDCPSDTARDTWITTH